MILSNESILGIDIGTTNISVVVIDINSHIKVLNKL